MVRLFLTQLLCSQSYLLIYVAFIFVYLCIFMWFEWIFLNLKWVYWITNHKQPSHKTFIIKKKLAKKMRQNRPIPHWIRLRTDNKIRFQNARFLFILSNSPSGFSYSCLQVVCHSHLSIRYNAKRRHWRRTKLGFWGSLPQFFSQWQLLILIGVLDWDQIFMFCTLLLTICKSS